MITIENLFAFLIGVLWYNLDYYLTFGLTTKKLSKLCNYNCDDCQCWHCQYKECKRLKEKMEV